MLPIRKEIDKMRERARKAKEKERLGRQPELPGTRWPRVELCFDCRGLGTFNCKKCERCGGKGVTPKPQEQDTE